LKKAFELVWEQVERPFSIEVNNHALFLLGPWNKNCLIERVAGETRWLETEEKFAEESWKSWRSSGKKVLLALRKL
jgi:hypothetical protein